MEIITSGVRSSSRSQRSARRNHLEAMLPTGMTFTMHQAIIWLPTAFPMAHQPVNRALKRPDSSKWLKISAEAISSSAKLQRRFCSCYSIQVHGRLHTNRRILSACYRTFVLCKVDGRKQRQSGAWSMERNKMEYSKQCSGDLWSCGINTFNFRQKIITPFSELLSQKYGLYLFMDDTNATYPKKWTISFTNKMVRGNIWYNHESYFKPVPLLQGKKQATERSENTNLIKYENITDFSNIVEVKTLEDKDISSLRTLVQKWISKGYSGRYRQFNYCI